MDWKSLKDLLQTRLTDLHNDEVPTTIGVYFELQSL